MKIYKYLPITFFLIFSACAAPITTGKAVSDKGENKFDGLYYNENKTNWSCNHLAEEDGHGASLSVEGLVLFNSGGSCQLTNPTSIRGMDATLFDGDCWGEGENYKYSIILMKDHRDDGIVTISNGYSTKLKNCNQ